jgi:hypothetical protein
MWHFPFPWYVPKWDIWKNILTDRSIDRYSLWLVSIYCNFFSVWLDRSNVTYVTIRMNNKLQLQLQFVWVSDKANTHLKMEVTAITYCISLWHKQHQWTIVLNGNIQYNTGRVNINNKRSFICNSNQDYETKLNFSWVFTQWLRWKYKICTWAYPILWAPILITLTVQYKSYAKTLKKIHCLSKTSSIFSKWCHVKV